MDADTIARAKATPIELEVERRGIRLRGKIERVGPCPICGGKDRFGINTRKQAWHCRGCGKGGDVIALAQHLDACSFADAVAILSGETRKATPNPQRKSINEDVEAYERRQAQKAQYLWLQRARIERTPAETYLRAARGYGGPLPATLGFLPPSKPEHHPAMIAAFGLVDEPEPGVLNEPRNVTAVHLTLLRDDGSGKADVERPKLIIGRPLSRPIVLAPANDLLAIAICEGIEDALTAHASTGMGAWAASAAGFMPALADSVPPYVECVTVFAHSDPAGQRGATELAERLTVKGVETFVEGLK